MNAILSTQAYDIASEPSNVINIQRGRDILTERQMIESAKISLFLAMVNPPREGETVADRVNRTKVQVMTMFTESGFDLQEADQMVRTAHSEAYCEFLKS